ncbi:MAG TPA: DUF4836 family protein [Chitinophagaceae bacterium]|nr:DUF4836 family protein [Chitinophagaceae bacterium]
MKQRLFLILSAALVLLASCGNKGSKSGLMVPKDAAFVLHINTGSLTSKLSWSEIQQTSWFKEIQKDSESGNDSLAKKLLADPSSSGVETKKDFVLFSKKHGGGGYMVFEGFLTSQATYEQTLAEMTKKKPKEIKKSGDFSYMVPDAKSVVVWNKSKFALVSNAKMEGLGSGMPGGLGRNRNLSFEDVKFETDSLLVFGQQALTLEGDNLENDSRYADLVNDGRDLHLWVNSGLFNSGMNMLKEKFPMANFDTLLKDNVSAMSISFENGKISAKAKQYFNEQMTKVLAANKPPAISAEMINRIPSSDVVAVFAFNFSPNTIREMLKILNVDILANAFLIKQFDISIDEIVSASNGGVLFAVSDPVMMTDTIRYGGKTQVVPKMPSANFLFATSVKDRASFEKAIGILSKLKKERGENDEEGTHGPMPDKMKIPGMPFLSGINYKLEKDWFVLTNSTAYTDKFIAGGNSKLPFVDKITGHPMGAYVDLQRIIRFFGSMAKDSSSTEMTQLALNTWENITAMGGDFNGKYSESEFEVNLVDKNTNSLKQLSQFIDKMKEYNEKRKEEQMARWQKPMMEMSPDSAAMAPRK